MTESIGPEGAALVDEARRRAGKWREAFGVLMDALPPGSVQKFAKAVYDWYHEDIALLTAEVERLTQAHERLREELNKLVSDWRRVAEDRRMRAIGLVEPSPEGTERYVYDLVADNLEYVIQAAPADERT